MRLARPTQLDTPTTALSRHDPDRPFVLFVSNATGFRVGRIMHGVAQECRKENLGLLWRDSE